MALKFYETKLKNGLTVIGEQRESAVSAAVGFFVRTGARDESDEVSGVSHFLEHMMFKGTDKRTALDINYELGSMGAQSNAFTSEENTVYYAMVLPEYFENALELLSDMMRPKLDEGEFETEKKVILDEIALYKDRPSHVLFEAAMRQHFTGHPAGNSVLGTTESITALKQAQMKAYFDVRYAPNNIMLVAAGNFSWERLTELAEKYCGHWEPKEVGRVRIPRPPSTHSLELTKSPLNKSHVCLIADGPSATDPERFDAQVLTCILGDSSGSRLYWDLIDKGLADSASVDTDEMDSAGIVYGYVSAAPDRIDQVTEILRGVMETPLEFTDDDLERAKTKIRTRVVLQGESSLRRLLTVGLDWVYRGSYMTLEEDLKRYEAVSKGSIAKMLQKYSFKPVTHVRMVPGEGSPS